VKILLILKDKTLWAVLSISAALLMLIATEPFGADNAVLTGIHHAREMAVRIIFKMTPMNDMNLLAFLQNHSGVWMGRERNARFFNGVLKTCTCFRPPLKRHPP